MRRLCGKHALSQAASTSRILQTSVALTFHIPRWAAVDVDVYVWTCHPPTLQVPNLKLILRGGGDRYCKNEPRLRDLQAARRQGGWLLYQVGLGCVQPAVGGGWLECFAQGCGERAWRMQLLSMWRG